MSTEKRCIKKDLNPTTNKPYCYTELVKGVIRIDVGSGEVLIFTHRHNPKGSWARYTDILYVFRAMLHILAGYSKTDGLTPERIEEIKKIVPHIRKLKWALGKEIDVLTATFNECSRLLEKNFRNNGKLRKKTIQEICRKLRGSYAAPYQKSAAKIIFWLSQYFYLYKKNGELTYSEKKSAAAIIAVIREEFRKVRAFNRFKKSQPK